MDRNKVILVVDDDPGVAGTICLRLEAAGYQTVVAHNGKTGLERALAYQPSAVVLDMQLPDCTGLDVLSDLRRHDETRGIPVIVLSGNKIDDDATLSAGAARFLTKPYDGRTLLATVEHVLAGDA